MNRPQVITLCGSMRFVDAIMNRAGTLTRHGIIVLAPFVAVDPDALGPDDGLKARLDVLHLRKIDMSDGIEVVTNSDGYVGRSTVAEMAYAARLRIPVHVHADPDAPAVLIEGRRRFGFRRVVPDSVIAADEAGRR